MSIEIEIEPTIEPVEEIIDQPPKKYHTVYYEANKEHLREKAKEKIPCPLCDKVVSRGSLNSHLKSNLCSKGQAIKVKQIIMGKLIVVGRKRNNYTRIELNN